MPSDYEIVSSPFSKWVSLSNELERYELKHKLFSYSATLENCLTCLSEAKANRSSWWSMRFEITSMNVKYDFRIGISGSVLKKLSDEVEYRSNHVGSFKSKGKLVSELKEPLNMRQKVKFTLFQDEDKAALILATLIQWKLEMDSSYV